MHAQTLHLTDRRPMRKAALIALALLAPLLIYWNTLDSMVAIWNRSETFTHQYVILPISLWLIWRRREVLAQLTPTPFPPALILLLLCGFAWLLGTLADVLVVRQYAFVAIVISAAVALLGSRISRAIAFPLLFLLLAVPFGEIFINPLIDFTANFTVAALRITGIPVLREGNSFLIPSGRWSVIEACSGVRYLIASFTLGLLYAHLSYRSRLRQAAFVLLSIAVPIAANGLRAYMIVMIGHLSNMELAVGVDHLIYGWLFFGLVMFLMFSIGGLWVEKTPEKAAGPTVRAAFSNADGQSPPTGRFVLYVAGIIVAIGIWPAYAHYMDGRDMKAAPVLPAQISSTWQDADAFTDWTPDFYPPGAKFRHFFRQGAQQAGLSIYYYRNQHQGTTLVSSANRILPEKGSAWNRLSTAARTEALSGRNLTIREETIESASGNLLIWHWYWIDGRFVENDYIAKLFQTWSRLSMHGDDGAALFAFAPYADRPEEARRALRAFLNGNLPAIRSTLADTGKQ
jgi:exosortase A